MLYYPQYLCIISLNNGIVYSTITNRNTSSLGLLPTLRKGVDITTLVNPESRPAFVKLLVSYKYNQKYTPLDTELRFNDDGKYHRIHVYPFSDEFALVFITEPSNNHYMPVWNTQEMFQQLSNTPVGKYIKHSANFRSSTISSIKNILFTDDTSSPSLFISILDRTTGRLLMSSSSEFLETLNNATRDKVSVDLFQINRVLDYWVHPADVPAFQSAFELPKNMKGQEKKFIMTKKFVHRAFPFDSNGVSLETTLTTLGELVILHSRPDFKHSGTGTGSSPSTPVDIKKVSFGKRQSTSGASISAIAAAGVLGGLGQEIMKTANLNRVAGDLNRASTTSAINLGPKQHLNQTAPNNLNETSQSTENAQLSMQAAPAGLQMGRTVPEINISTTPTKKQRNPKDKKHQQELNAETKGETNRNPSTSDKPKRKTRGLSRFADPVRVCENCGRTDNNSWRKGTQAGFKTLCNACGLRLSRQLAKNKRIDERRASEDVSRRAMEYGQAQSFAAQPNKSIPMHPSHQNQSNNNHMVQSGNSFTSNGAAMATPPVIAAPMAMIPGSRRMSMDLNSTSHQMSLGSPHTASRRMSIDHVDTMFEDQKRSLTLEIAEKLQKIHKTREIMKLVLNRRNSIEESRQMAHASLLNTGFGTHSRKNTTNSSGQGSGFQM